MNETSRRRPFRALCLAAAAAIAFGATGALALVFAAPAGADTPLAITSPSNGAYWGISQGDVSGVATGGDVVTVASSQGPQCTATADITSGDWSCELVGLATAQTVTINASDEDAFNNSATVTISVVNVPNITSVTGGTQNGQTFYDSESQPTISGTSEPNAVINIGVGSTSCPADTTADGSGNWTCTVTGSVDPSFKYGSEQLGMDASQQPPWATSPSDYIADIYQYAPPLGDPVFSSPVDTSGGTPVTTSTSVTVPTLAGSAAPNANVNITYSGPGTSAFEDACDTVSDGSGHFSCPFAGDVPLTPGNKYLFRAEQINGVNPSNTGANPLFYLNILAPPVAPVITGPSVPYSSTLTTVNISGTEEAAATVQTVIDGVNSCKAPITAGAWSCSAAKLTVGTHTLSAYAIDQWGTRGPSSAPQQFTIKAASQGGPLVLTGSPPADVPTPTPTPSPTPAPTALPTVAPTTAPAPSHHADGPTRHFGGGKAAPLSINAPIAFSSNLGTIGNAIKVSPIAAGVTGGVAAGFLGLVAFPSELLENTIRANYETAFRWLSPTRRWFASARKRVSRFRVNPWVGGTVIILLSALILGFASPEFGFNGSSVRLFAGLVISLAAVNLIVPGIMSLIAKKWFDVSVALRPLPAALLLVLASALISRFAELSPGFLFAGIIGISYAGALDKKREGVLTLISTGLTVVLGLAAWLGYSAIAEQVHAHPEFWNLLWSETFTATTIEALATLVIALLPFKFMDGSTLFNWKPWVWAVSYLVSLVILIFVIAPISDNWGPETAPLVGWTVFFVIFAIVAVGVWAAFRFRPSRTTSTGE